MDAWEALLLKWNDDGGLPCYHLMEKYSTGVLGSLLIEICAISSAGMGNIYTKINEMLG
jgi:hypothetical protein